MEASTIKKYKDRTHPWLMRNAQVYTNKFARLRDSYPQHADYKERYFNCVACGKTKSTKQMQAGHFYSAGEYNVLRFNLFNVNGECVYCNYYSGDHLVKYQDNLIAKIGQKEFDKLKFLAEQSKGKLHKYDRFTLIEIIEDRKNNIKGLT